MSKLDDLISMHSELVQDFERVRLLADDEVFIDEFDLDSEALRTPKLLTRWLGLLGDHSLKMKSFISLQKRFQLERWKYYLGTQTDKYYSEYGIMHTKILKTDVNTYLDADEYIIAVKRIVDTQEQIVIFIERTIKEISARTFHIKSAIDWRRFQSGS